MDRRHPSQPVPKHKNTPARKDSSNLIMGKNAVLEILRFGPDRVREVLMAERSDGDAGDRLSGIAKECERCGIAVRKVGRHELDRVTGSESHQGVVASIDPRLPIDLEELLLSFEGETTGRLLALDGVLDPQNVGAIIRAAECFGVDGIVWSRNRSAPLGPVVSKASVGASEIVPLAIVANLHRALETLKKAGWWIVGAAAAPDSVTLDTFVFPERTVVVMGSEGSGMHQIIEKALDFKVAIPMEGRISSLNVSQATAVFLAELSRQHRKVGER